MTMEEIKKYRIITLMRDIIVYPLCERILYSAHRCAFHTNNIHLISFASDPLLCVYFRVGENSVLQPEDKGHRLIHGSRNALLVLLKTIGINLIHILRRAV